MSKEEQSPNDSVERKPVKVELSIKKDDKGPGFFSKVKGWCVIGLAGGAMVAVIGSVIARPFLTFFSGDLKKECQPFVESAMTTGFQRLMLVQGALLLAGFVLFFLIAMLWKRGSKDND